MSAAIGEEIRDREVRRVEVTVAGVVQGVGFRPFVYRVATRLGLAGSVRNTFEGAEIGVEGAADAVDRFLEVLRHEPPPIARIDRVEVHDLEPCGATGFRIVHSEAGGAEAALVSPDVAVCDDCFSEMRDPSDRRYRYPFVNCTNCGPRFTIVEQVPYDRPKTTMRVFEMCDACRAEYEDPSNRRYHAQPNACGACGPHVSLVVPGPGVVAEREDAVERARTMLGAGRIVAVKGLGGFHLACDAADERAVAELRARKGRPCKPLAVMCRDLEVAGARCEVSDAEALELSRPSRPILLLRARGAPLDGLRPIAASVAPRLGELGVMLPYTPLHHLLLEPGAPPCLVMTSGNESGLPIQADEREAVGALGRVADAFLVHDRAIWNRCDDSVGCVRAGRLVVMRRSRGLAPLPVALDAEVRPTLALGAMLCNTVVIASGRRAFFSQHIGDAETEETLDLLREIVDKLGRWLGIEPEIVAHDLHPDLPTTHLAVELGAARRRVAVQHHHAHLAAAMAAAGVRGEAIGLVLDGTGYGTDASIWGGEILVGSAERVRRAGHLRPLPLPGGDAAIKRPLRTAVAYVRAMAPELESAPLAMWHRARPGELDGVRRMVDRGLRTPRTTSAGRLFDAVAALLDVADDNTYEGQAAIELEHLARRGEVLRGPRIGLDVSTEAGSIVIDPAPAIRGLGEAALACGGASRADLAACFHAALSDALATSAGFARDAGGPATVVLCGGVFQNRILDESVSERLVRMGFDVVRPGQVPVNDGGLALGQVLVANRAEQRDGAGAAGWEA